MIDVIPAILPKSQSDLAEKVSSLAGTVLLVHIDVLPDTFPPEKLALGVDFEVHIQLIADPMSKAPEWVEAGAKRIIVQAEDFENDEELSRAIAELKEKVEVGLSIEMETSLEKISAHIKEIDFVQLMAIDRIGAQGRPLDRKIFAKIKEAKEKFPEMIISIDGGVNESDIKELSEAGADRFVVGSAIFQNT